MGRNSVERQGDWVTQVRNIDRRLKDFFLPMTLSERARVESTRRNLTAKIYSGGFRIGMNLALMSGDPQFAIHFIRTYPRSVEEMIF